MEFIPVNHSIPDAVALGIKTPIGYVVHTGDFKIDCTPIMGHMIDLARFGELGNEGVLALLADSTNAERPGFTPSERVVGESFANLFKKAENKRIIIATFSSNMHRIQQIMDAAVKDGRKVAVSGRSMINVVTIATELGYLHVPDGVLIDIDLINRYPEGQDDYHHHRQPGRAHVRPDPHGLFRAPEGGGRPRRLHHHFRHPHSRQREDGGQGGQRADEARLRRGV